MSIREYVRPKRRVYANLIGSDFKPSHSSEANGHDGLQTGGYNRWARNGFIVHRKGGRARMPNHRKHVAVLVAALVWVGAIVSAQAKDPNSERVSSLRRGINFYRQTTWRWQLLMGEKPIHTSYNERKTARLDDLRWLARGWMTRAAKTRLRAYNPPHKAQWLCIHRYEGSWTDPAAPYWGGLQMDMSFQATYGARLLRQKGTADNWTPLEQMWVAEKAFPGRGFHPWPNTAHYCGLI